MSTIIKNAKIFDGENLIESKSIAFENGILTNNYSDDNSETIIDANGCTLLPGLIDSHVHVYDKVEYLEMAVHSGITTMLDMGSKDPQSVNCMKNHPELISILSSYSIACASGSTLPSNMNFPDTSIIKTSEDAVKFVNEQVSLGADYIKLILENKNRNQGVDFPYDIGKTFVETAHKLGKLVIAHAVTPDSFKTGADFLVDILTHIPFEPLSKELIDLIAEKKIACVPTIVMMKGIIDKIKSMDPSAPMDIKIALQSVGALHKAGVKIFAGTDSNMGDPATQATIPYGTALHDELSLLVESEFTPIEALRAATSEPAEFFQLHDRGILAEGKRADLLLVEGDPTTDINHIRNIKGVWVKGKPVFKF